MLEMPSIESGSRLFSAGGDDRSVRPENHEALKCPRCDSLNTKFCYYNNYNLSQPRYFCKACRRYWTKGGVLRNVPVGGGCRKTSKRSKPKQKATTAAASTATATTPSSKPPQQEEEKQQRGRKSPNSHYSSESSSLTAANATTGGINAVEVGSNESKKPFESSNTNSTFNGGSAGGIFSEIGSFSSFINDRIGSGFSGLEQLQQDQNRQWQQMKLPMTGGFIDQTVDVELSGFQSRNGGGFGTLDWGGTGGVFDLPNTVDHNYWNQSQWTDLDQNSLYLP